MLVLAAPDQGPLLAEALCEYFNYSTTCYDEYSVYALGPIFSQVVALGDMGGYDGQVCSISRDASLFGCLLDSLLTCWCTNTAVVCSPTQPMPYAAGGGAQLDRLVPVTEAQSSASAKTAQRGALEGSARVRHPY